MQYTYKPSAFSNGANPPSPRVYLSAMNTASAHDKKPLFVTIVKNSTSSQFTILLVAPHMGTGIQEDTEEDANASCERH
jgi:hypothetical protein